MKKIYKILFILILSLFLVNTSFASIEDDQIIDKINQKEIEQLNQNFKLQTFSSCENLNSVMEKYIKTYWKLNKKRYYWWPIYRWGLIMEDMVDTAMPVEKDIAINSVSESKSSSLDYSKTNTQVAWVDESEIVKTDGKYIYYYNQKKKAVYIADAQDKLKIVKKIKIPTNFYSPVLYVKNNKLVILSWGYARYYKRWLYWRDNSRTYIVIYDLSDINNLKLEKFYVVDWKISKSRRIKNKLYVISTNSFNIPFYSFKKVEDIVLPRDTIIPKKIEINKTSDDSKKNLVLKWKKFPYNVTIGQVASCNEIEYSLPTEETLKKYDFSPSYNIVSIIDIDNPTKEVKTKVIVWNTTEIYMSLKNLYLTDRIYSNNRIDCPPFARCIMPYFEAWENTMIHKMNILPEDIKYQTSTLVPWNPLTQYSMDEKWDNFRIITQKFYPKRETWVYILDKDLKLVWELNWLWENENFKSSRFMWDKLFLVTFKNIDPFYVIDLKDEKNPKVIWKLKIPGYSEYLHPYDENHIIWLWFDTFQNKYGWTRNGGLKLDLYEINYDKKVWTISTDCSKFSFEQCPDNCIKNECASACPPGAEICTMQCVQKCENPKEKQNSDKNLIEVKQLHSLVMWDAGSYSEVLRNPRMFIYNKNTKTLLLPVTIQKNEDKDSYKIKDFFQWLYSIKIDLDEWIKILWKISHIDYKKVEEERLAKCEKYFKEKQEKEKCRILLDWSEYCPPKRDYYVPEYCYKDSTLWSYIARNRWNFRDEFIKRALYIWNNIFSISDKKIKENDMDTFEKISEVEMK